MGQKINPNLFRLTINQKHLSNWYTNKNFYKKFIEEDFLIRLLINDFLKNIFVISTIKINRFYNQINKNHFININLNLLYPQFETNYFFINNYLINKLNLKNKLLLNFLINKKNNHIKTILNFIFINKIKNLLLFLKIKLKKNIFISLKFIEDSYTDVNLISKIVINQLQKRIPFRKIINQLIINLESINILGFKIQLSGRLDGIDIARREYKQIGSLPLQTLNSNIIYSSTYAKTTYGIIGIKLWLNLK